jgi:hypothetical protein
MLNNIKSISTAALYIAGKTFGLRQKKLIEMSAKTLELSSKGAIEAINPLFKESHLDRIRGASSYGPEQVIKNDLCRKIFYFKEVKGYWLKNATLLDGSIYTTRYRHELRNIYEKSRIGMNIKSDVVEVQEAGLVSTCAGSTWWGHWVEDEAPLQMLVERLSSPFAFNRKQYRDECVYRRAFGLQEPPRLDSAYIHNLLLVDEFAQNPNKTKRYRAIRERFIGLSKGYERIYLRRGKTGMARTLVNEDELLYRLNSLGFVVIDVEKLAASEIIEKCNGAAIVISIEGSHLAPLLYLTKSQGLFIILNPPYQVHTTVADIGVFCGISSAMFICEPDGDSRTDFYADPEELVGFVEEAITVSGKNASRLEQFVENVIKMDTSSITL